MKRTGTIIALASCAVVSLGLFAAPAHAASCGIQTYADGTVGPTVCPDGDPNTKVLKALTREAPAIMGLAASSSRKQIQRAVCADRRGGDSGSQLYDAIEYQAAAYGWTRHVVNPVVKGMLADSYC